MSSENFLQFISTCRLIPAVVVVKFKEDGGPVPAFVDALTLHEYAVEGSRDINVAGTSVVAIVCVMLPSSSVQDTV